MQVQLPNGDVAEFPDNMKQADIEAVLQKQFAAPSVGTDVAKSAASGVGIGAGNIADALNPVNWGHDLMANVSDLGQLFKGQVPNARQPSAPATQFMADLYQPKTEAGRLTQGGAAGATTGIIGGLPGVLTGFTGGVGSEAGGDLSSATFGEGARPIGSLFGALAGGKVGNAALNGIRGFTNPAPSPESLRADYVLAKNQTKNIDFSPEQVSQGLTQPTIDAVQPSVFNISDRIAPAALQDLQDFGRKGTNAYQLDEFRSQLGGDPLSSRIRDNIDTFTDSADVPTDYRDLYRRSKLARNITNAMDAGGSSVTQARTRLRNVATSARGSTPAEQAALRRAGSIGIGESAARVGRVPAAILSAVTGSGYSPSAGLGVYAGGRILDNVADAIARRRMNDALQIVLRGGKLPPQYSGFGALTGFGANSNNRGL
ncbi:MAG: hypothetical protein J0I79_16450 [Mesorhizobium sp.]|uniref:hypothetical protein n=1 Tax=Mesorhizobium sp. TaxID=1871066 RepID=UPI001ACBFAF4|nr:hypothetical protein [Mesorhizobium sp.]MBN9219537.1 hypothetical protein [Mesorhizobium sp.]